MPATAPKILVIDDDVAILRLLKTLLSRMHYEVVTAESATEAFGHIERATFACVITDALMPDLSGFDFVRRLRSTARYAGVPVLMLTQKRNREDVKKAVEAGVTDYIFKPIDENLIVEKIEACIKKTSHTKMHEVFLPSEASEAEVCANCRISSLGPTSMTLLTQYRLEGNIPFRIQSRLFGGIGGIGIPAPLLRLECCDPRPGTAGEDSGYAWEAKVSFGPLPEADEARLREWLSRL